MTDPVDDPWDSMSEDEIDAAMREAQERARKQRELEDARIRPADLVDAPVKTIEDEVARMRERVAQSLERERRQSEREEHIRDELVKVRQRRWESTVHAAFADATIENLTAEARDEIASWIDNERAGSLLLFGEAGRGKTHAAIAVQREYFMRGRSTRFWSVPNMLDALRPSARDAAAEDVMREAREVDLLILDDLGSERSSDWTLERLYIIVNDRWMAKRRNVVTTNCDPVGLSKAIGERMFSRFKDRALLLEIAGDDRRPEGW